MIVTASLVGYKSGEKKQSFFVINLQVSTVFLNNSVFTLFCLWVIIFPFSKQNQTKTEPEV